MTTTLLAVDDSQTMRKVLEITFAGEDFNTVLADNSANALAKLADAPAIALVDAGLGNESGYDLCQQIKSQSPSTRVIILSSKQAPYDAAKGSAAGADEHHDKPFDTQQLLDKVAAVLGAPAQAAAAAPKPAAAPAAPAPAAAPAPVARPPAPAQPRAQTVSFGTPPAAPATPQQPRVASTAPARTHTMPGTPAAPAQSPAPAPVAAPRAPAPAAAPAPAPAPAAVASAAAASAGNGQLADKLAGLGLTPDQVNGVLAISREVIEQVVWEVVPVIAETMIQEEIARLTRD